MPKTVEHAVPSCVYSFWHGVIPTSYFIVNDLFYIAHTLDPTDIICIPPRYNIIYKCESCEMRCIGMMYHNNHRDKTG